MIPTWVGPTILAATVGSVVTYVLQSLSTPDYGKRIDDLTAKVGTLLQQQSESAETVAGHLSNIANPKPKWFPKVTIDNATPGDMCLSLKADRDFALDRVAILGPNGAVLKEIDLSKGIAGLHSTGFRVPLPQDILGEIRRQFRDSGGSAMGRIRYEVSAGEVSTSDELAFVAEEATYKEGRTTHIYTMLKG